jgi:hypothetical protein
MYSTIGNCAGYVIVIVAAQLPHFHLATQAAAINSAFA